MSRGGRGGRGGRRGGGELSHMPGADDPDLKVDNKPSELFPDIALPPPRKLTEYEEKIVKYAVEIRKRDRQGPLFTGERTSRAAQGRAYGQDQINKQYRVQDDAADDPFMSMPSYTTQRIDMETPKQTMATFHGINFSKELFPEELWSTISRKDDKNGTDGSKRSDAKRRRTDKSAAVAKTSQKDQDAAKNAEALASLDKFDEPEDKLKDNAELELVEDDADYDNIEDEVYEDDEEGDYNAEANFDGGEDDGGMGDYGDGGDEATF